MADFSLGHSGGENAPQAQDRLEMEWTVATALREAVGLARSGLPTYADTLAMAKAVAPRVFNPEDSLLLRQQENADARRYRQMAAAQSAKVNTRIEPLDIVNAEIEQYTELLGAATEKDQLRKHLGHLESVRREFEWTASTENQAIFRDAYQVERTLPVSGNGKDYKQYVLPNGRVFRVRVLHPNPPEHSMGADLVYEHYWDEKELVRIAALQYKVWDRGVLYQEDRMMTQLRKFGRALCDNTICAAGESSPKYRLPHCSAFLRPTDKLQRPDSSLMSSGLHIPLCVLDRSWQDTGRGGKRLERETVREEAVSHHIFEEMFHSNMLGSRWLNYEEMERLYQEHQLLSAHERIVLHVQDFAR